MDSHVVLLVLAATPAAAQAPSPSRVEGMANAVFRELSVDSTGCAVGVRLDGRTILRAGYGMASLELGTPITPETVFGVASMTKQFTAFAVALLADEGRLSLDDDVRRHVPELPDYGRTITLRHLIHHTSGIRDYLSLWSLAGRDLESGASTEEVLHMISSQRGLNFPTGSDQVYSNSGYFLLGEVVARVTGEPLGRALDRILFSPLGMRGTRVPAAAAELIRGRATSYRRGSSGLMERVVLRSPLTADGGMYSTIDDVLLWDAYLDAPTLGTRPAELVREATTSGRTDAGREHGYGYGFQLFPYRGARAVAHGGTWGGYRGYYLRLPEQRFAAVVLCNQLELSPFQFTRRLADSLVGVRLGPAAAAGGPGAPRTAAGSWKPTTAGLQKLAGAWHSEELAGTVSLSLRGDSLVARRGFGSSVVLRPDTVDRFQDTDGTTWDYRAGSAAGTDELTVSRGRARGIRYRRARLPERGDTVLVPRGGPVRLDGFHTPGEWPETEAGRLTDGSPVFLLHDGQRLHVGIRPRTPGFPSICVARGDTVHVLHASAALGSVRYVRRGTAWAVVDPFAFAMRSPDTTAAVRAEREAYLIREGWVASTVRMGNRRDKEMTISLPLLGSGELRLALGEFLDESGGMWGVAAWPGSAGRDGCADPQLVRGFVPERLEFDTTRWARLVLR